MSRVFHIWVKASRKEGLSPACGLDPLWKMGWNCDVKDFGDEANAIKYLGGYARRGPISDSRILEAQDDMVTISARNRDTDELETRRIEGVEFVRRYLQQALPQGCYSHFAR